MDMLKIICVSIVLSVVLTLVALCVAYTTFEMLSHQNAESTIVDTEETETETEAEFEDVVAIPEKRYLGRYKITGYDTCIKCCGKDDGITASGEIAKVGRTCAAPENIPFGTKLYIEGIGERIVEDRGGFDDNVIDVLCENHSDCYALTGYYDVYIMEDALNAQFI